MINICSDRETANGLANRYRENFFYGIEDLSEEAAEARIEVSEIELSDNLILWDCYGEEREKQSSCNSRYTLP